MKQINNGAYPTMITPYNKDKSVDYKAAEALVEYFWEQGCDGIFAVCLSSEIFKLSLEERIKLAEVTKRTADRLASKDKSRAPMSVVASGHVSDGFQDQITELGAIAATGVDAVVLISNRFDIGMEGFDKWKSDAQRVLDSLDDSLTLGIYECPVPYKRVLDADILKWVADSGRFSFIKDTCCDAKIISERLEILKGSDIKLFNAHTGTLLETLRDGAVGYCGVMANYIPKPFVKLCQCYNDDAFLAEYLQAFLTYAQISERMTYPISAKYYLNEFEGVKMTPLCRTKEQSEFDERYKVFLSQLHMEVNSLIKNKLV